jgi:ABC-type branched-subunit amino acid transport system ATPase component/branched-subunit amino acid ABC-type transport system permease component
MIDDFLPFIVSGLTVGAIYGLSGTGLVLTYKTSGIFNFAHPAFVAVGAYSFWMLHYNKESPWPQLSWQVAALVTILVVGPVLGLGMELLARGLSRIATSLQILATIGLLLGLVGTLGLFRADDGPQAFRPFLPTDTFELGGTFVGYDQLIQFLFSLVAVALLFAFFRFSRAGIAMRAVVDNPPLLDVMGRSPNQVRRGAWILGLSFAVASGVLLGGTTVNQLNAGSFVNIAILSFGAAAIGRFSSLPLTFGGGLLVGIIGDVSKRYVVDVDWLKGFPPAVPFLVLFVVLLVTRPSLLQERRVASPKPVPSNYYAPISIRIGAGVVAVAFLAFVPQFVGVDLSVWLFGLTYVVLFLSIGLLVKLSGQVSLCHTALAAVGGATLAHATTDWGLPWGVAIVIAGLMTAVVGLAIALPAIRVSGVFLALATLGFGLMLQQMIYPTGLMFGASTSGIPAPRPSGFTSDESYYYLVLAIVVVVAVAMAVLQHGRLGRLARALGDSPLALNTAGTTVTKTLITVFALSAFLAGIAGALFASASTAVFLNAPMYQPFIALQLFAVVLLLGAGTPWYAIGGAASLQVLPFYVGDALGLENIAPYLSLLFGVAAVAIALIRAPGTPPQLIKVLERFRRAPKPKTIELRTEPRPRAEGTGLEISDLRVRYGGFIAVDELQLKAPVGRITGLIGPNGAGKTTTFNVCSGLLRPAQGKVFYNGVDITRQSTASRARRGIGRTFQRVELWPSLTVAQNVALGAEASMAGGSFARQVFSGRSESAKILAAVEEAVTITGIDRIADRLISDLSTGEKRLVELARVLAGPFDLLLLDEPSSGLDTSETQHFGAILREVLSTRGTGALLVEHDMTLVSQVCDYLYVLDFGMLIFEGTPEAAMDSEIVRTAYLGTEPLPIEEIPDGVSIAKATVPGSAGS